MRDGITILNWARLAAYIDGEGCIIINRTTSKLKPHWNPHYSVAVIVANSDPRLVVWCRDTFGGILTNVKDKRIRKTSKTAVFTWRVSTNESKWVLTRCLPYFILKREQAEIALAMYATFPVRKYSRWETVPPEVISKRDALVVSIQDLKKRVPSIEEVSA